MREEKCALRQDPTDTLSVPTGQRVVDELVSRCKGVFWEEVPVSRAVSPHNEAAQRCQVVRRAWELGRLVLCTIIASVCWPYGLLQLASAGRGMLLLAQCTWQPAAISGKQNGHLNEPRPSIIIKARPRNQSYYLPAHMMGKMLPVVTAKLGSKPTRGLSGRLWMWARAAGEPLAPSTRWFNLQVTHLHHWRAATGWRETSGCQRSIVTSSLLFPPKALDARSPSAGRKACGFWQWFPEQEVQAWPLTRCLVTLLSGVMERALGMRLSFTQLWIGSSGPSAQRQPGSKFSA